MASTDSCGSGVTGTLNTPQLSAPNPTATISTSSRVPRLYSGGSRRTNPSSA